MAKDETTSKKKGKSGGDKGDKEKTAKKTKGSKGGGDRFDESNASKSKTVDILDDAAMENAYNICHNVQDLLYFRGFFWEGDNKKGKGKGRKKKGKGK